MVTVAFGKSEKFLSSMEKLVTILPEAHGNISHNGRSMRFEYATSTQADRVVSAAIWIAMVIGVIPKVFRFNPPAQTAILAGVAP